MPTYAQLDQRNPEYDSDTWCKLDELYEGGFCILKNAARYLPRYAGEHQAKYAERLGAASYVNYLGAICDQFIGQLFEQELVVAPPADKDDAESVGEAPKADGFWEEFAHDADLRGNDFACVVKDAFTSALLKRRGLICCDFPFVDAEGEAPPDTRAEEEAQGRDRGYAYCLPIEELLDWEYSSQVQRVAAVGDKAKVRWTVGRLKFAVTKRTIQQRDSIEASRSQIVEEFTVWRLEDGVAVWERYRTDPRGTDQSPDTNAEVKIVGNGKTSFREIPIVELCMPKSLWLGNKLGPMSIEHFQGRSGLNASVNRALFALLCITLGSEIKGPGEALPADRQQNPSRGDEVAKRYQDSGAHVLGSDDDMKYVEPEGKAFQVRSQLLKDLVDEMYRISHQMASSLSSTSKSVGRSGDSKAHDWRSTEIVLGAFGALVRDLSKRVYDVITDARGENVVWVVHGLDNFKIEDRETLIKEAAQAKAVSIPSKTFKVEYAFRMATALLGNVPPETQTAIKQELVEGIEAEEEMSQMMRESLQDGQTNGAPDDDESEPDEDDGAGARGGFGQRSAEA